MKNDLSVRMYFLLSRINKLRYAYYLIHQFILIFRAKRQLQAASHQQSESLEL